MADLIASRAASHLKPGHMTARMMSRFAAALATRRQRRKLSQLPADLRVDMGLSDAEIDRETARSFWDVPAHWRV